MVARGLELRCKLGDIYCRRIGCDCFKYTKIEGVPGVLGKMEKISSQNVEREFVRQLTQNVQFDKGIINSKTMEIQKPIIAKTKDYTVTLNGTIVTVEHSGESPTEPYKNGPFKVEKPGAWEIVDSVEHINPWAIIADLMRELAK